MPYFFNIFDLINTIKMKQIPKTKLEIELTCDKILLVQQVKKLQTHLQATLNTLDFVLNEKLNKWRFLSRSSFKMTRVNNGF